MSEVKTVALRAMRSIAESDVVESHVRLQAAQTLLYADQEPTTAIEAYEESRWYEVGLKDLTVFFLKCVVGVAPAVMLATILYVGFIIFTSVSSQLLGGL
jgi:hypothetical protein